MAASPFILPSGRLFAPTGERKVKHVVLCLFAGGIRNLESIQKKEGCLMRNILGGDEKISEDILPGMHSLPSASPVPLISYGTLYKEFRYKSDQTIHLNGHATAIMGAYSPNIQIMQPLPMPTIFELYRKHSSPTENALNAWWVSDQGGPFNYLNYSSSPGYGADFGANLVQSSSFFKADRLGKNISISEEEEKISRSLISFLNQKGKSTQGIIPDNSIENDETARAKIASFIETMFNGTRQNNFYDPWNLGVSMNEDLFNIFSAIQVLQHFKPGLLVVNMQDSDIAHSNFTQYCNNIRKADFGLQKLWEGIQAIPEMKDETVLIAAPEFGRNLEHNTLVDAYGRKALDHTGDSTSKEIFCLVLGPQGLIKQRNIISEIKGESIDIAPTIAHLLGFEKEIPKGMLKGKVLEESLV